MRNWTLIFNCGSSQPPSIQSDSQDFGIGNPVPPPILNEPLACYLTDWGMLYRYEDCILVLESNMTQGNEELVKEWLRIVRIVTAIGIFEFRILGFGNRPGTGIPFRMVKP